MDFSLNEEQQMIRDMARKFGREIEAEARKVEEEGRFSRELTARMAENGFLGMPVPEKYGGMETDYLSYLLVMEEIARSSLPQAMTVGLHGSLLAYPLMHYTSEEQKAKYLVGMATGELLGCYALSEPNAGSDAASITTEAKKTGKSYIINGTKIFATNGSVADFIIVFAKTDPDAGHKGISAFIVDADAPGFEVGKIEHKMGLMSSPTCELIFKDVAVPGSALLGEEGIGLRIALETLDGGRVAVAATAVGVAEEALAEAVKYSKERVQFGKPIGHFQGIQWMIADMQTEVDAARWMTWHACWLKDSGQPYSRQAAEAKLFATETASKVVNRAVQIHGGYGFMKEYKVEQLYRDVKATEIYEGTSEVQRTIIGRSVLKD